MKAALTAVAVVAVLAAVLLPKLVMVACLSHDGPTFAAIAGVRERVRAHKREHGRFPERLEDVGLPALTVFSYGPFPKERIHWHKVTAVEARRGLGATGFAVQFSTWTREGAKTVAVAGDFNGFDAAKGALLPSSDRAHWNLTVPMSTGTHSYRWVFDGRPGPLETREFDHSVSWWDSGVEVLRPAATGGDGVWLYDPETGLVVLACDGGDTKRRRPWRTH